MAGLCLFWVYHDIDFKSLIQGWAHINWWLMALSVVLQFLAYTCVAWEWQLLLTPVGALPLRQAIQAVFSGRFANDALPLQLGYLVRAALAARWLNVKILSIFPSLIVERLWDGVWIAAGIGMIAMFLPLPAEARHAADVLGVIVVMGTITTVCAVVYRGQNNNREAAQTTCFKWKPLQWLQLALRQLVDGVRDISRPGLLGAVSGLALLRVLTQATAFLALLWAYRLQLPLPVGLAAFLVGYLGLCIPSTPAGTGMFQLFVVAGLTFFGVSKTAAAGFALAAFFVTTVPLAVAGFFAFAQSGLHLREVRDEMGRWKQS